MTKQPGRAQKSLKERFFDYLTRVVLTRHFQKMKLAKQDTNYIEQQLMVKTNQGAKRIGVVTLQFVDGMTPADKVAAAEACISDLKAKLEEARTELLHFLGDNKAAKSRIATLEEVISQSTCALKEARVHVRDICGPFANELKPIDCAIDLNNKVLKINPESWVDKLKNFNEKEFRKEYLGEWSGKNASEKEPYSIVNANVLLLDGHIIGWKTGSALWDSVEKSMWNKQLFVAIEIFRSRDPLQKTRLSVRNMRFVCNNVDEHNKAFSDAREFYKTFPIHPEYSGYHPHHKEAFIPHL